MSSDQAAGQSLGEIKIAPVFLQQQSTTAKNTNEAEDVVIQQSASALPPFYSAPPGAVVASTLSSLPYDSTAAGNNVEDREPHKKTAIVVEGHDMEGAQPSRITFWRRHVTSRRKTSAFAIFVLVACLVGLAALGAIGFGISLGVERGLTGENFWSPGHKDLFRICESASTSSKAFQAHTCNVFRPLHDMDAPPLHSFVESVRSWTSTHKTSGQARRIDPFRLDALLLNYRIKCSKIGGTTSDLSRQAQIIVGGVGQGFSTRKYAIACNYRSDGTNAQDHCGRYNDGGLLAPGHKHPLGLNAIMTKHFNMTCEWIA